MDSDSNDSGGPRTEGVAHDDGPDIPKFVYHIGRTTGHWKDTYYNVREEISGGVTRLLDRAHLDDNGEPCGLSIAILEKACPPKRQGHPRLSHKYDDHGRVERVHERILARYNWGAYNILRRNRAL